MTTDAPARRTWRDAAATRVLGSVLAQGFGVSMLALGTAIVPALGGVWLGLVWFGSVGGT